MAAVAIGQVILGTRDLDAAQTRLESDGLRVLDGGVHPGLGTENRIVPLGDTYLELLGIRDEEEAAANDYGRSLLARTEHGDELVRWSIRTDDIDRDAARLGLEPERRERLRPDGSMLRWRAAGIALSLADPWLPFFMQWDDPLDFPGALPVAHPVGAAALSWIEVATADPDRLDEWIGARSLPVRRVEGEPGFHAAAIATPAGELVIRP